MIWPRRKKDPTLLSTGDYRLRRDGMYGHQDVTILGTQIRNIVTSQDGKSAKGLVYLLGDNGYRYQTIPNLEVVVRRRPEAATREGFLHDIILTRDVSAREGSGYEHTPVDAISDGKRRKKIRRVLREDATHYLDDHPQIFDHLERDPGRRR